MYDANDVRMAIRAMRIAIVENEGYLGELDGRSGDGDLGISMSSALNACSSAAESADDGDLGKLFMCVGMACNKAAPSTMGTLLTCGIFALAKESRGKSELADSDIVRFPRLFADAIADRGNSKRGDKTILDALYPLADSVEASVASGMTVSEAYSAGAEAARKGAEKTAGTRASVGRAKWLGERAAEYPDAGATMCAIVIGRIVS